MPMADVSVLSNLSPVYVALLSPLLLREAPSRGVLAAIPACLLGVLLVAQPTFLFGGGGGGKHVSALGVGVCIVQAFLNAQARMSVR